MGTDTEEAVVATRARSTWVACTLEVMVHRAISWTRVHAIDYSRRVKNFRDAPQHGAYPDHAAASLRLRYSQRLATNTYATEVARFRFSDGPSLSILPLLSIIFDFLGGLFPNLTSDR